MIHSIYCGIPMNIVQSSQSDWLEGIGAVTNRQWQKGVEPLLAEGAKYCLLEPRGLNDFRMRQLGSLGDLRDTFGHDNVPQEWNGRDVIRDTNKKWLLASGKTLRVVTAAAFQWFPEMSDPEFGREDQPVVHVSWYHAKAWAMAQGGLYLLSMNQRGTSVCQRKHEGVDPDDWDRQKWVNEWVDNEREMVSFAAELSWNNLHTVEPYWMGSKLTPHFRSDYESLEKRDRSIGFRVGAPA